MGGIFNTTKLQAVLASASMGSHYGHPHPHHPIGCYDAPNLAYHPDGAMECPHARAEPTNARTLECLNHSIAILLMELAAQL